MKKTRLIGWLVIASIASLGATSAVLAAQPAGHAAGNASATLAPEKVNMVIVPDSLRGPDKHTHDAYLPSTITATAGQTVIVTVYNLDTATHSFTSKALGLNVIMAPAKSDGGVAVTTFVFTPKKAGTYQWLCIMPCDNGGVHAWAMTHDGYMSGDVIVANA